MTGVTLSVAALLIALNGAFVALEFGAVGARRSEIATSQRLGRRGAASAARLQTNLSLTLAGAQVGITLCSLALGRLAEPALAHLIESALHDRVELSEGVVTGIGFGVALAIVVVLHTVIGEMVPKNLALAAPERSLVTLAPTMAVYTSVVKPFITVVNGLANAVLRMLRIEPAESLAEIATPAELEMMVAESHQGGMIGAEERALLDGALRFGEVTASEVMVPMIDVDAVPTMTTVAEIEWTLVETGHSRLVVYGGSRDDVRGFVHGKDLLTMSEAARSRMLPIGRIRPMVRVRPDTTLPDVLQLMRRARTHLGLVTEDGVSLGVLTLDDVMAGLVGTDPR